jgi:glucose/arabinose dehydrogenase
LALAWQPVPAGAPEILWATVTERNGFGDDLVPDFATALTDGGFYGWPYAYIGKHYDPKYLGGQTALVNKTLVPDIVVPAHSAPSGLAFYTPRTPAPAKQYPSQYWGLFLTLSGSADNSSVARGFKVVFVPFEYNQQTQQSKPKASAMVDFVTGFVSNDGAARGAPINFWGRPTALLIGSDGSLLVLDEADPSNPNVNSSKIWKVTYNPPVAPTP